MKHRITRIGIFVLEAGIVALTVLWGLALFTGQPQPAWNTLTISNFTGATIIILPLLMAGEVLLVGISSLLGAATIFVQRETAIRRSMVAGLIIAMYQLIKAAAFLHFSGLEAIYLVVGLAILGLAWYLLMTEYHGWTLKRHGYHLAIGRMLQKSPLHP